MQRKILTMACTAIMLTGYGVAQAAPFTSFDPRSMAMGGAGVAVGNAGTAPLFNPALLSAGREGERFAMEIPIVGARFYDPDDFIDTLDAFQDSTVVDDLDFAINTFNNNGNTANLSNVTNAARDLDGELIKLGGKPLQGDLGAAVVMAGTGKNLAWAVTGGVTATFGGIINYRDSGTINTFTGELDNLAACIDSGNPGDASCNEDNFGEYVILDQINPSNSEIQFNAGDSSGGSDLQSSVDVRGLILQEFGISFAREVELSGHRFAVGVTPKYVKATMIDYTANVDSSDEDDFDGDNYSKEYSHFNLDVGVAKDYANGWRTGLVIRNLISQTYDGYNTVNGVEVATGNSIKTSPQVRLGVSHQQELYTVAADLDLTENDPVGYEGESRYLALGAELNAWDWAQLRVGYRANLSDSERNVMSAGIGLSPFGVHLDLAVARNSSETGGSLQFGFRF